MTEEIPEDADVRLSLDSLREAKLEEFVERLARLTTPYDETIMRSLKKEYAAQYEGVDPSDVTEDEVIADLEGDYCFDEAIAFWRLIQEARELLK